MSPYRNTRSRWAIACLPVVLAVTGVGAVAAQGPATRVDRLLERLDDSASTYVFIAAHRGGWERDWENRAPENSLANIEKAIRMGFDFYETDVRRTSDGELVIMHDATVDRTTNGSGAVAELTFAELRELRLKYTNGRLSDETVPSFEEFLARGRGRMLFKADYRADLETLPEAVRLLEKHDMLGHVILRLPWSDGTAAAVNALIEDGLPYHRNLFQFQARNAAEVRSIIDRFHPGTIEVAVEGGVRGFGRKVANRLGLARVEDWLEAGDLRPEAAEAVRMAREAGVVVAVHSTGGPGEWQRLLEHGIRMLHTREPERLSRWLQARGLRESVRPVDQSGAYRP